MCAPDKFVCSLRPLSMTDVPKDDDIEERLTKIYGSKVSGPERKSIRKAFAVHKRTRDSLYDFR